MNAFRSQTKQLRAPTAVACTTDRQPSRRRGATMVESAIVLSVFLLIIFGMLDIGLAVLHYNSLSDGARRLAREAIVHGSDAEVVSDRWGPSTMSGHAGETSPMAVALQPSLVAIEPADVSFAIEWIDGTNEPDDRLRVTLSYDHEMMIPFFFGDGVMELRSVSTMRIAH